MNSNTVRQVDPVVYNLEYLNIKIQTAVNKRHSSRVSIDMLFKIKLRIRQMDPQITSMWSSLE